MRSKRSRSRRNLSFRPGKHPLDRPEALFENGRLEDRLAAPLRLLSAAGIGVDVGNHAAVEDRLAVGPAVVDAIEADDGALKKLWGQRREVWHHRRWMKLMDDPHDPS